MISINQVTSVFEYFCKSASTYPEADFLHVPYEACKDYSSTSIEMTYAEAYDYVKRVQAWYESSGIKPGHRVALSLENRPVFFIHFLALNAIDVSIVPINPDLSISSTAYILEDSSASVVLAIHSQVDKLRASLSRISSNATLVTLTNMFNDVPEQTISVCRDGSAPSGEASLLYTSGTTGKPKGCILSNEYFLGVAGWYLSQEGYCKLEQACERLISPLPVYHSNALAWSFVSMIGCGGCIVMLDRFHPSSWWPSVVDSRATIIHYLGVMPAILLSMEAKGDQNYGRQVKFGFGAGVDPRHHRAFEDRFGFPLIEAWAMTETGAGAVVAATVEPRHVGMRCFGRPGADLDYRILDEDGNDVDSNESGHFVVRRNAEPYAKYFFDGYHNNP
ncbi:MAG: AMP-binding protein, partial [Haliea sp.]|uniref:AMP-binding protein n=1 Tax=Haliea sp. TaxID=1932666 RepID=UPI0032EDE0F2